MQGSHRGGYNWLFPKQGPPHRPDCQPDHRRSKQLTKLRLLHEVDAVYPVGKIDERVAIALHFENRLVAVEFVDAGRFTLRPPLQRVDVGCDDLENQKEVILCVSIGQVVCGMSMFPMDT